MFQFMTKKELSWGTLTGVRPTKITFEKLEAGLSDEKTLQSLQEDYYLGGEKADLSLMVAKKELSLLKELDYKNGYSIYIGIPFCPSTCLYCSFTSYPKEKYDAMIEPYLNALYKEIAYAKDCFPNKKLSTVYIGGGTPTTLSAEQLDTLLTILNQSLNMSQVKEFTVEAGRPDSITMEKLMVLKKHGVTRISINPQSMQQKTLDLIGRKHTITEVTKAFQMAREAGHANINMDIIIGLPGETYEDVQNTLKDIDDLNPDSLTVHTLAVKRAARLNIEKDRYVDTNEIDAEKMLILTQKYAKSANYLPYYLYRQKSSKNLENTGYAKNGKEGYYNILIMEEKQSILALGAGGLSKFIFHSENRLERVENVKSLKDYIERIDEMILRKKQFLSDNAKYL
jgi:coproporphyrinogen dehydrogenase HemZ